MVMDLIVKGCIVSWLCIVFAINVSGQNAPGTLQKRYMVLDTCVMQVSPYTLMPTLIVTTQNRDTLSGWQIVNNSIVWDDSICIRYKGDTVLLQFRTMGFNLEKPVYIMDTSLLAFKELMLGSGYEYRPDSDKNPLIDARGLDYRGSFSRGLSIGNSQSLVLNSNFDMQMIGDLGNGLKIVAAISDDNLPIQAQGNTQQLQEFDKVFIQVTKDKTSITAGDYDLRKPNSYFMNYYKKLKGISLATTIHSNKGIDIYNKGSFAISRGKFARQTLATAEGNQGPYRLQGNNNERFIIVLAGTEKVYYNGILLTRGFDYDYVIDYNRAEVTFSPSRVITRESRVIIEFEYTDISYLRSLYATQTEFKSKKWSVNFNFYSEQDSKQGTGDIQLDSTDLLILADSGDDLTRSVRSSIRRLSENDSPDPSRVFYAGAIDPTNSSNIILRYTENRDSAIYTAVFTEVGQGKGDYIIDSKSTKNGRVYKYAGFNQGAYLPVVQLVPPEQRQMFTLNGQIQLNRHASVYGEIGLSNVDLNRISGLDKGDNTGLSSFVLYKDAYNLDTLGKWQLNTSIQHEFVNRNFVALNPYRSTEFSRDWNLPAVTGKGDENLLNSLLLLKNKNGFVFQYGFDLYNKRDVYDGNKHKVSFQIERKKWGIKGFTDYLSSTSAIADQTTSFLRPDMEVFYKMGSQLQWKLGFVYGGESNYLTSIQQDTLKKGSVAFNNFKWYLENDISDNFGTKLAYSLRKDYLAKKDALSEASVAHELEWVSKWTVADYSDLQWSIIGRKLSVEDAVLLPNEKSKNTILGKLDYTLGILNQGIRSVTTYNTNSGQEPKVEYVFKKVEPGLGDYVYIGNEENSNLNNIQDFRYDPTNPNRSYIRLSLTNNEFIRTNNIELNQSIQIEPVKFKKPAEGVRFSNFYRFLSRFSTTSNFRISKKLLDRSSSALSSFLNFGLEDTTLVSYNSIINNTLFFNKGNVRYDIQIGNRNSQNRTLQVSGQEDRGLIEYFFRSRFNIFSKADLYFIVEQGQKKYTSEAFKDRNLDIVISKINPEISYRPSENIRLIARYEYQDKQQRILTKDVAYINNITSQLSWRKATEYNLDMSLSMVWIKFSGLANSPLEYDMLDGLKNGRNLLWNAVYTRRIAKNMDLTFNYEGRKSGLSPIVHIGRAQVKATF